MNRAIKYRLYPNSTQKELFSKTFGCCRKVWNLMLSDKIEFYKLTGTMLKTTPAQYKRLKEYEYLKEVDSLALANVQLQLETAYKNFFRNKNTGFPKFKSAKHESKTYTTNNQNGTIAILDNEIKLPKIGFVKAKIHRKAEESWQIKSATIVKNGDNTYEVSVLFSYEENISKAVATYDTTLGIDYKSNGLYVTSSGEACDMPHFYRKAAEQLAKKQRKLKNKVIGSNNYKKEQIKIAKFQKHTANQRKDFLHKKSVAIAKQYDCVCVENLNMKNIASKGFHSHLGKATFDNGYGLFLSMMEYKLRDRGKEFVKVDKFYPSSQICFQCGQRHKEMKNLRLRTLSCECGYVCDRDVNAAQNIKKEGFRLLQMAN